MSIKLVVTLFAMIMMTFPVFGQDINHRSIRSIEGIDLKYSPDDFNVGLSRGDTNYALQFDGGDAVVIPHSSDLEFSSTSSFTIELWFMITSSPSVYHILGKRQECATMNYQIARDNPYLLSFGTSGSIVSSGFDPACVLK